MPGPILSDNVWQTPLCSQCLVLRISKLEIELQIGILSEFAGRVFLESWKSSAESHWSSLQSLCLVKRRGHYLLVTHRFDQLRAHDWVNIKQSKYYSTIIMVLAHCQWLVVAYKSVAGFPLETHKRSVALTSDSSAERMNWHLALDN